MKKYPKAVTLDTAYGVDLKATQRTLITHREEVDWLDANRPKTRADCENMEGPCPFLSCKFNLYLDVNPETGSIKLNFPDVDLDELPATCALDVADQGGLTLEEVGDLLNLTRERIRQLEMLAQENFNRNSTIVLHHDGFEVIPDQILLSLSSPLSVDDGIYSDEPVEDNSTEGVDTDFDISFFDDLEI